MHSGLWNRLVLVSLSVSFWGKLNVLKQLMTASWVLMVELIQSGKLIGGKSLSLVRYGNKTS